jgi:hypothetical protein
MAAACRHRLWNRASNPPRTQNFHNLTTKIAPETRSSQETYCIDVISVVTSRRPPPVNGVIGSECTPAGKPQPLNDGNDDWRSSGVGSRDRNRRGAAPRGIEACCAISERYAIGGENARESNSALTLVNARFPVAGHRCRRAGFSCNFRSLLASGFAHHAIDFNASKQRAQIVILRKNGIDPSVTRRQL